MIKKALLLVVILVAAFHNSKAQNWANGIDDDQFNWGYSFQYISTEYKLWKRPSWRESGQDLDGKGDFTSISSRPSQGFAIGFVGNRKVTNHLDLRLTPNLVFTDRNLSYTYQSNPDEVIEKRINATMIDLPLSLKLKSDRLTNFRAYIIGGLKYSIDMASSSKNNNAEVLDELEKKINNKKSFLSYEAGAGMDFYFSFFKMSTEVKVSQSFKNILIHENHAFSSPIEKAKLRHFTFSLFFE
ncbi:MAG: PorT family protein [Pedobacter sp.]|nr:MAG: PorT family protein [Pedobacter sp.]